MLSAWTTVNGRVVWVVARFLSVGVKTAVTELAPIVRAADEARSTWSCRPSRSTVTVLPPKVNATFPSGLPWPAAVTSAVTFGVSPYSIGAFCTVIAVVLAAGTTATVSTRRSCVVGWSEQVNVPLMTLAPTEL